MQRTQGWLPLPASPAKPGETPSVDSHADRSGSGIRDRRAPGLLLRQHRANHLIGNAFAVQVNDICSRQVVSRVRVVNARLYHARPNLCATELKDFLRAG